nr:unnamed protein product [Fasciola hepatica]
MEALTVQLFHPRSDSTHQQCTSTEQPRGLQQPLNHCESINSTTQGYPGSLSTLCSTSTLHHIGIPSKLASNLNGNNQLRAHRSTPMMNDFSVGT